ncbi:MAG: GNAT family N-acetyltransferase [Cytophagales bacterium]|nr:MAG: GNAT family N-acetyltransferase [Cytophagales bacterium]
MHIEYTIRLGQREDVPAIWGLVRELAIYEKAEIEHTNTIEMMYEDGFGAMPIYQFYVAEVGSEIVGMALFYYRYSTWKGKCLYLEDFYVKEHYRQYKIGFGLFKTIIQRAYQDGCKRISWQVLDWNQLAIDFYNRFEASMEAGWLNAALTEEQIKYWHHHL